jgi:hypothetical protein
VASTELLDDVVFFKVFSCETDAPSCVVQHGSESGYFLRVFDLHGWKDEEFLLPECATYPSSDVHDGWMGEKFLLPQGRTPLVGLVLPAGWEHTHL